MKKKDSIYLPKTRSYDWLKVINYLVEEVYLMGYKKKEPGWLIVIENEFGEIRKLWHIRMGNESR